MKLLQMPGRRGGITMESSSGPASGTLLQIWATDGNLAQSVITEAEAAPNLQEAAATKERSKPVFRAVLSPETAFYRSYTEAMLRRYSALSMEGGRVPSLLGRDLFRGRVTSCRVRGFDDVVIFVHDVEQCIRILTPEQQRLIHRIGVQDYTFGETAGMLRLSLRSVQRRYFDAIDELTAIFLKRRLLERIVTAPCQEGGNHTIVLSHSPA